MWAGGWTLLLLSVVMGTASFLAGTLPLSLTLSTRQLRMMTALGTGVLVGTSLIVIIPEGVETLYSASANTDVHSHVASRGLYLRPRHPIPLALNEASTIQPDTNFRTGPDDGFQAAEDPVNHDFEDSDETGTPLESPNDVPRPTREPHAWVGFSLILGFILMYLIDTLPRQATPSSQPRRFHINLNNFSLNRRNPSNNESDNSLSENFPSSPTTPHPALDSEPSSRPSSTTIGLVIHAAADGIALGASSSSSTDSGTRNLTFIIFLALMIHKAPAAFGLTSVLLKQGLSKRVARAHLLLFSLAAPVGALLTWAAAHWFGYSTNGLGSTEFATGVLLLFSGGTFLYVAMHTMQEATSGGHGPEHRHGVGNGDLNGYVEAPAHEMYAGEQLHSSPSITKRREGLLDTMITVAGMLFPLLTLWGHAH